MRKWWLLAALVAVVAGAGAGAALRSEDTVLGSREAGVDRAGNAGQASAAREAGPAGSAEARERRRRASRQRRRSRFTLRPAPADPPVRVEFARKPRAGILFDVDTGEVLWERHPDRRLAIASLTKMLTALIIVERHRPGEMVEITPQAVAFEGSGVGVLPEGERVRLETLLQGLLLVSGNDAAIALAQHDAGLEGLRRAHEPLAPAPRPALLALHEPARPPGRGQLLLSP